MSLRPYRHVLAIPGVRALFVLAAAARIPSAAIGITLTLHVANAMGRSWAEAGLATAAYTVGAALGMPLIGRLLDRRGLRTTLAITASVQGVVWTIAPLLAYRWLLAAAAIAGLLGLPIYTAIRLSLAALVPAEHRRPAFAMDSMIVELSFMVGPLVAVALLTSLPSQYGIWALGAGLVTSGATMCWRNPPTRPPGHQTPKVAPSRRSWLRPRLLALMVAAVGCNFVLSASELAVIADIAAASAQKWTGIVIALWCLYSLLGGLVFGAGRWRISAIALVIAMSVLTVPIAFAPAWVWLIVFIIPSGMLCAPSLAAINDDLARIVPPDSRGEANGWLGSALTAGTAIASPITGAVIDHHGSGWAYAVAGLVGLVLCFAALPVYRRAGATTSIQASPAAPAQLSPIDAGAAATAFGATPTGAGITAAGATQAGATQAGATQAGATQAGATQAGATQAGATQAGATQAGATQAGATQAGVTATEAAECTV